MDYGSILERAFRLTIKRRELWVFALISQIILAGSQGLNVARVVLPILNLESFYQPDFAFGAADLATYLILSLLTFALTIIGLLVRLITRPALIGMVGDIEELGDTDLSRGFSHGIRNFLPLLAIYLVVWIPLTLLFMVVAAVALSPLLLLLADDQGAKVIGVVGAALLGSIALLAIIAASIGVSISQEFMERARVLRGKGVFGSIADGFQIFRQHPGQAALVWLLMLAVGIIAGMLSFAVFALLAAFVGVPVFIAAQMNSTAAIVIGIILGLPALLAAALVSALVEIYSTAAWTLAFLSITGGGIIPSTLGPREG